MVIDDFHLLRVAAVPHKAYPPLVIDADAVLSFPCALECFQPIARRHLQIPQCPRPMQVFQLAPRRVLHVMGQLARASAAEDALGLRAREAGNHEPTISLDATM